MTFSQLRTFVAIVEKGNFSLAARFLHISQPAVSMQMQKLEADVGASLLERHSSGVELTPAGDYLFSRAREILDLWDETQSELQQFGTLEGELRVGCSTVPSEHLLPEILTRFTQEHPNVHISVDVRGTQQIVDHVLSSQVDVGMIGSMQDSDRLDCLSVADDRLVAIAAADHPIVGAGIVQMADLVKHPFVVREVGSGTLSSMLAGLQRQGVHPETLKISARFGSTESVVAAVEAGLGLSFVSERSARHSAEHRRIAVIELEDAPIERCFCVTYLKRRASHPLIQAFLDAASKCES